MLNQIANKIENGERLSEQDALDLYSHPDLFGIMELADRVNRKKNHNQVFYNINRHINPTNICALSCKFCAYSRKPGQEGAYAYSIEEMVEKAGEAVAQGATEVHMVGGLHPRWRFQHYRDMIAAIKQAYPDLHLKAFTVVELDWMARREKRSIRDILVDLREAGLGSLPGGGAEIFAPEVREAICETKVPAELWLSTHKMAHELGMHSNCTMLYGHIERFEHRVNHMAMLRQLQDETRGFNAFIPLAFQPFQNEMGISRYTYGYDDLKTIAIARLFMDNFQHIKAYWIMLGQDIAQLALAGGANDLDGTVVEEKISRMAGGRSGMSLTRSKLEDMIRRAGRIPVERDTLYHPLTKAEDLPPVERDLDESLYLRASRAMAHKDIAGDSDDVTVSFSVVAEPSTDGKKLVQNVRDQFAALQDNGRLKYADSVVLALGSLDDEEIPSLADMLKMVWSLREICQGLPIVLRGLKNLWRLAQREQVDLADILGRLREAGVAIIESSHIETESDLTHSELATIHRSIHSGDISTIAKVELSATKEGKPLWNSFRKRLAALNEVNAETGRIWGVSVEVSPGATVTPIDFLQAVAEVSQQAPTIRHLVASLSAIPSLSAGRGLGTQKTQHASEKWGPICALAGASDLGRLSLSEFEPESVFDDIRSAGLVPRLRDGHLEVEPLLHHLGRFPGLRSRSTDTL